MAVVELEYPDDEHCGMAVVGILGDECRGEGKTTLHKKGVPRGTLEARHG